MGRPERVVDVRVGELGEPAGERGVVGLLARIEPQVLEQDDRGVGELIGRGHLAARPPGSPRSSASRSPTGARRSPSSTVPLGRPRCEASTRLAPRSTQFGEGGQGGADPGIVGHRTVLQRDVEVDAHEDTRPGDLAEIVEGAKRHSFEATRAARSTRRLE